MEQYMKHFNEKTGKNFEIGRLVDSDGGTYDINVITKWDEENDYEQSPIIVDYYFGDYDKDDTDNYIDQFLKRQETLKTVLKHLNARLEVDGHYFETEEPDEFEKLKQAIESVKEMITDLV
jgi:hypothetical protein